MKSEGAVTRRNLAEANPKLVQEWHPTKNGFLSAADVSAGSHKKIWWKCPKGPDHEWQATVKDRNAGRGCGICAGKIIVKSNSLETLNPTLARQWHPIKNGNLTPAKVGRGSNKVAWWQCRKNSGHAWQAKVADRYRGDGCPFCANRKVSQSNSFAKLFPKIAAEWHPDKNGSLSPSDIVPGSNIKAWWRCAKERDHIWRTSVAHRLRGTNCPMCANRVVSNTNSLAAKHPEIAGEWHPTKNGKLTPEDIVFGSNKRVWWQCAKGPDHEWKASIYSRSEGGGCPVCSNKKIVHSNSLLTLNPALANEWHPERNGDISPNDFGPGSNRKVWWQCSKFKDHQWKTAILHRTNGNGCPFCSNRKVAKNNSLATVNPRLAKEWHQTLNGLLTPDDVTPFSARKAWWQCPKGQDHVWASSIVTRNAGIGCPICKNKKIVNSNCLAVVAPDLALEWHPSKNGKLTPYNVGASSGKKVWWQCSKNSEHQWQTSLYHRRKKGTGCPFCTNPSSGPELRILSELSAIFEKVQHRVKINSHEVDIYLPDYSIGIEYDGEYWHRNKQKQDRAKTLALSPTLMLIRVREKKLAKISETDILLPKSDLSISDIKKILLQIKASTEIQVLTEQNRINAYLKQRHWLAPDIHRKLLAERDQIEFEDSISFLFPEVATEWHPTKNAPLNPAFFTPGSSKKVWWKCPKGPEHEWFGSIQNRTGRRGGCPVCSNRKIVKSNCLAVLNPKLAAQWHPKKNGNLSPYDVGKNSNKKAWWKCPKNPEHEWKAAITGRASGIGCPICANKKVIHSNSLATLSPKLAKEWHPTKNGNLGPADVPPGSHKKVWWLCPKGSDHEWEASIKSRSAGNGCAICANKMVVRSNSLATLDPLLAKEWHPTRNNNLTPQDVHPGSSKHVWWVGSCGHEWQAQVLKRTIRKQACPKCRGQRISLTKNKTSRPQLSRKMDPKQMKLF